ncbi:MAG: tetratricopeptide repeat protein [Candidatus Thermoplasmatota archaeon]
MLGAMARQCIKCQREISDLASICSECAEEFLSENIFGLVSSPIISSPPIDRYREDSEPVLAIGERPEGDLSFEPGKKVLEEVESWDVEELDEEGYRRVERRMNVILAELGVPKDIDFEKYFYSKKEAEVFSQLYYTLEELEDKFEDKRGFSPLYLRVANLFYYSYKSADTGLFDLDFRKDITDDYKDKAEGFYELAAQIDEHDAEIYPLKNRAFLLLEFGELERAESFFGDALSVDPDDLKSRFGLIETLLEEGKLEEAEEEIERVVERAEEDPQLRFLRGELARKRDKWGRAVQFYNEASESEEDGFVPAMLSKASLFLENEMPERSSDIYEKVIEIDEEDTQALKGLGVAYRAQGESKEALRWFNKALAIDSHDKKLWVKRAEILQEIENFKEAVKDYNNALEIDSGFKPAVEGKNECIDNLNEG